MYGKVEYIPGGEIDQSTKYEQVWPDPQRQEVSETIFLHFNYPLTAARRKADGAVGVFDVRTSQFHEIAGVTAPAN